MLRVRGCDRKGVDLDHLRSVQEDVDDPLAHPGVDAELSEFGEELGRNDSVAGELCKLARVTGPEFPPPLLSSGTLPASDWPVRGGIKDSACPVSVPCAEKCWSTPTPRLYMLKSVLLFP